MRTLTVTASAPSTDDDTWAEIVRVVTAVATRAPGGGRWTRDDQRREIEVTAAIRDDQDDKFDLDLQMAQSLYREAAIDWTISDPETPTPEPAEG